MRRVADHLDISELERRFRTCPDPVEARHVQVIWLLAQGHTVGATSEVTASGRVGSSNCWSATTRPGPTPWPTGADVTASSRAY